MKRHSWWIICLVFVVSAAWVVQAGDHSYVGAEKCKMCHKVQYTSWLETVHAKATEAAKQAPEFSADCLKCHATNADESLSGVQCEACHGPGSDYKKMSIMKDREKAVANGLIIPSQETCDGCHVDNEHSKAVSFEEMVNNKGAIHEFKAKE